MVKTFDNLPMWAKMILALPFFDILWIVYRLFKSIDKKNTMAIVMACILLIIGIPFLWLIDLITIAFKNKVLWID